MTPNSSQLSREKVLHAFAAEADHSRTTLDQYLKDYPEYSADLVNLSRELSRKRPYYEGPLTSKDQSRIDDAWQTHLAALSDAKKRLDDLTPVQQRAVANQLGVPRQIITAFRERKVLISTVPRKFLRNLASSVKMTLDQLTNILALSADSDFARSYKADGKPVALKPISFENLLIEAGIDTDSRTRLMSETD